MDRNLTRLFNRLEALEKFVGYQLPRTSALDDQRLNKAQTALRYGTSTRSIDRKRRDAERGEGDFPAPEIDDNGRCYWWLSALQAYDQRRALQPVKERPLPALVAAQLAEPKRKRR